MPPPTRALARAVLFWAAAAVWAGAIFYFSSLSNPFPGLLARAGDKLLHAVEYAGLGLLLALGLRASGVRPRRVFAVSVVVASLYAASDEIHQAFVPGRHSDVRDWLVDTLGAGVAALVVSWVGGRRRSPSER